jgi:DNA polymerase (family 10)
MEALDASAVARLLVEFGQRMALRGGNPYRARAYATAAENLMALTHPLKDIVAKGRLREIPGVGPAIADIIATLHRTGTHPTLEAMRRDIPATVLEMMSIPGLRPDKVAALHRLGITTLAQLEQAARADELKSQKGVGAALQRKILQGLEVRQKSHGGRHMHRARELLAKAEANLRRSHPELKRIAVAGDFRRGCELVSDLCLVAEGGKDARLQLSQDIALHVAMRDHYGAALLFATGSQSHLEALAARATEQGMTLSSDGLRRGKRVVARKTEADIYKALGLAFIPPELREGGDEIERAASGQLPVLVADDDLTGILHAHTDRSDGVNTLEDMADATRKRGYSYFGVADHSQSAHYAGGLKLDEIEAQQREVDRLNARYGSTFRIFKGIESDILADGALDYPDDVLARFDFVVASVHSRFRLDEATQTDRIVRAVANPHTTILGHATGRQLLRRPGYEVDLDKVLAACAAHGVAVEINANPWRLDIDWRWHGRALELGCMLSINPDAHSIRELDLTHWGVEMARKGGVPKERVLNCLPLADIKAYFAERKRRVTRPVRRGTAKSAARTRRR